MTVTMTVVANSRMGARLKNQSFNLLHDTDLVGSYFKPLPFFLFADEILPLRPWLLRPSPQRTLLEDERVYNYRHSEEP